MCTTLHQVQAASSPRRPSCVYGVPLKKVQIAMITLVRSWAGQRLWLDYQ